ncbi:MULTISPECIES: hypothetical protein [Bacillus cereus group]|uniref:Uncharacterized protein n=1 Tax=Bacillus cereus VD196 TaxID=1053243 RepID=A0A9W5Q2J5_BACCE|nr:hypothetical protein [Bacillus cereus]EOO65347.1 hypothetical protein IKE_03653 [Bacillus cereus VD196]MBM6769131.1 hypothetical protein [Bacillus cereus]
MQLSNIRLELVKIQSIVPIYAEHVSKSAVKKLVRALEQGSMLSSSIIVEKDKFEDKYWLVSGFPEYIAYLEIDDANLQYNTVYCVVQPYSNETEQRLKLLQRMFHHQVTKWIDKHILISQMVYDEKSIDTISKKLGVNKSDIERYFIHPDIPISVIEKTYQNSGSFINLEQIRKLKLHSFLKDRLYEKVVLPQRHVDRLTTDKLQKLKWVLKEKNFYDLKREDQWDLIQQALNYKGTLQSSWSREIQKRLKHNARSNYIIRMNCNNTNHSSKHKH